MRLSLMGSWVLKSTHGSSRKRMLLLMHNGTPLDLLNDVLFCSLEKFHFGGEAEALMGELCMLWPQYALRQLLYWWERMCERGETQSLVVYLVPIGNAKFQLDFQILPISTIVSFWWCHHDVLWARFALVISVLRLFTVRYHTFIAH